MYICMLIAAALGCAHLLPADTCEDVERFRQRHKMLKLNIALKSAEVALLLGLKPATEESDVLFRRLLAHTSTKLSVGHDIKTACFV